MNPYKNKPLLPILLLMVSVTLQAQVGEYQNLYFIKKNETPRITEADKDYKPSKKGFYIYRNCIYDLALKNKLQLAAKITDIRNDSIYYTVYGNGYTASENKDRHDTFSLHPSQIRKIRMIGDRIMGIYAGYGLGDHNYFFEQSSEPKRFKTYLDTVYAKDSSRSTIYEVVPYMTAQGIDWLYEQCGVTYYYRGITEEVCKDTVAIKPPLVKKGIWFSPTNANEVRGVNIGAQTASLRSNGFDIKGVNLNADILSLLAGSYALVFIPFNNALINMPDTVDKSGMKNKVSGLSLSAGGLILTDQVKGVSINGGICTATETKGIVITGSQNVIEEFYGVVISGLKNKSIRGKGVQIGLWNICKHLKGIQVGLWNVNSKRKLPFINWSF